MSTVIYNSKQGLYSGWWDVYVGCLKTYVPTKREYLSESKLKDLHSLLEDSLSRFDTSPNSSIPFKQHKTTTVGFSFTWQIYCLSVSSPIGNFKIKMVHPK